MKNAADFRLISRNALRGKWLTAIIACLVATLLGGIASGGPEFKINLDSHHSTFSLDYGGPTLFSTTGSIPEVNAILVSGAVYILLAVIVMSIIWLILGGVVEVGYSRFNLGLVDGDTPSIDTLFSYFSHWKTTTVARLLQTLYILLWSLLFVIPGIIATYSYAMTGYILAEQPELTASEAITLSKQLMDGNRWRLFCLHLSFIGWDLLCALTLGIGNLWLAPYKQTATAAFYREISGTERIVYDNFSF